MQKRERQNSVKDELRTPEKHNKKQSNEKNIGSFSGDTSSYLRIYQTDAQGNKDEIHNSSVMEEWNEDSPPQKTKGLSGLARKFSHMVESDSSEEPTVATKSGSGEDQMERFADYVRKMQQKVTTQINRQIIDISCEEKNRLFVERQNAQLFRVLKVSRHVKKVFK